MAVPETRALLSKEAFSWTIFRFLRMRNHRAPSVTIAMNTSPPTTPPAIAPELDFDLLADAVGVRVGVKLVLVIIADEADAEAADAEADAEAFCSAATTLKLLPVRVRLRNAQLGTSTLAGRDLGNVVNETRVQSWFHVNQSVYVRFWQPAQALIIE